MIYVVALLNCNTRLWVSRGFLVSSTIVPYNASDCLLPRMLARRC